MKILTFYSLPLVFDDIFGCLGQEKEGVRNDPQLFVMEDWVDIDFRITKSSTPVDNREYPLLLTK